MADTSKHCDDTQPYYRGYSDDIEWHKRNVMGMKPLPFLLLLNARAVVRILITPGSTRHSVLQLCSGGQHCPPIKEFIPIGLALNKAQQVWVHQIRVRREEAV